MTSPVEELREAAKKLRELAGAATAGPWDVIWDTCVASEAVQIDRDTAQYKCRVVDLDDSWRDDDDHPNPATREDDAEYIASMHPGVALALASVFDRHAWMLSFDADLIHRVGNEEVLALARTYLGRGGEQR